MGAAFHHAAPTPHGSPWKELELLGDGANVSKLIGPILVKQDPAEAKANVKKCIEYISAELKRMDRALKDLEEKQNSKKESNQNCKFHFSCILSVEIKACSLVPKIPIMSPVGLGHKN
ncbi:unnamed protein product [Miscanthus lutarioriparius]|uniref:Uncharacterized protein n=1 Tax=Miscanthus lutarioriparius TaxID=422564 RepID=A0A811SGU0_9POAL|nr:unnamed protein product [Miscanthus lutarioriparius]